MIKELITITDGGYFDFEKKFRKIYRITYHLNKRKLYIIHFNEKITLMNHILFFSFITKTFSCPFYTL